MVNSVSYGIEDGKYFVSFDIDVQGAELFLKEMKVFWAPNYSENSNKIEIQ